MNTAEIYRKATTPKQPPNPLEQKPDENVEIANAVVAEGMEKEQREKWMENILTDKLICYLSTLRAEKIKLASLASSVPTVSSESIRIMMGQVSTLNEVINYIYGKN